MSPNESDPRQNKTTPSLQNLAATIRSQAVWSGVAACLLLYFGYGQGTVGLTLAGEILEYALKYRSEERRVGKECRSRWSPYH